MKFAPVMTESHELKLKKLRVENKALLEKVEQLETGISEKLESIEKFLSEKKVMEEALKLAEMKILNHEVTTASKLDQLKT